MRDSADSIRIASQTEFMDKLLPVSSHIVDGLFGLMVQQGVYVVDSAGVEGGHWRGFPLGDKPFLESQLYQPFVEAANVIATVAKQLTEPNEDQVRDATWTDYHKWAPQSLDAKNPLVKPDCILALAALKRIVMDMDDGALQEEKKKILFWLQAVAVVEGKRVNQSDESVVRQLLGYLRMIMVEQKDRRFALGLAYSRTQLSVWLQDRSGALGMDEPIQIHKEPKKFIQIIAALAILPAHRLGFDPTMQLYRQDAPPIPTYRLASSAPDDFDIKLYKENNYATQWVIKTEAGAFVTLKALSLLRTDVVRGSGSIVWAAVRYEDLDKHPDQRQTVVLKQAWRTEGRENEGALYEYLQRSNETSLSDDAQYLGEVMHSEDVKIEGVVDNTHGLIQCGLQSAAPPSPPDPRVTTKRALSSDIDKDNELLHVDVVTENDIQNIRRFRPGYKTKDLAKRTHTRIIFKVFGLSIRYFASLSELIQSLQHCVRGHKFAFVRGVLQCDVSPANLLIALIRGSERLKPGNLPGCLIDLDHGKRIATVADRQVAFESQDATDLQRLRVIRPDIVPFTDDVLARAFQVAKIDYTVPTRAKPDVIADCATVVSRYILAACDYAEKYGQFTDGVCTPETFGWDTPLLGPRHLPTTTPQQAAREPRSGTPPYASAMLLNSERVSVNIWQSNKPKRSVLHDAIHDIESFFWVLLYLCITRSGPGGDRREDLDSDIAQVPEVKERERMEHLRRVVHCFFDGDTPTLAKNKKMLFEEGVTFETEVLIHIHPYFKPLEKTLRQWWDLLLLAYEFQGYEYHDIHNRVIALLEDTLVELDSKECAAPGSMETAMMEKREDYVRRVLHVGWHSEVESHVQQPSTPHMSPTGLRISTALDNTPESQKQQRSTAQVQGQPTLPSTPPGPAAKKVRR
ncbi:hypothetical protein BD626DRAFT_395870 [Schizophyllum amplum]|uniref:Fungal-type protein kinase domain-containing protein n=1 Tax=Schizophyllum amplum TaxID=97359 RepID=A0A550CRF0_9AGAR|nr:hypothetical protein BD626DRAFT_395870 [Auriculariopsis ampla]